MISQVIWHTFSPGACGIIEIRLDLVKQQSVSADCKLNILQCFRTNSRWYCAEPSDMFNGRKVESIDSSYSYLGSTKYECCPGYWFQQDMFVKVSCVDRMDCDSILFALNQIARQLWSCLAIPTCFAFRGVEFVDCSFVHHDLNLHHWSISWKQ